jgi:hypothetical protein
MDQTKPGMKLKHSYEKSVHTRTGRLDSRSKMRLSARSTKSATAATALRRLAAERNDTEMAPLPPLGLDGEMPELDTVWVPVPNAVLEPETAMVLVLAALLLLVTPRAKIDCMEMPSGLRGWVWSAPEVLGELGEPHVVFELPAVPLTVPEMEAVEELLLLVESAATMENDSNVANMPVMVLCDMAQSRSTWRICEVCLPGVHGEERVTTRPGPEPCRRSRRSCPGFIHTRRVVR